VSEEIILIICPNCGRARKYGKWIYPNAEEMAWIMAHRDEIAFDERICEFCKEVTDGNQV
jgi:hypothetical protein